MATFYNHRMNFRDLCSKGRDNFILRYITMNGGYFVFGRLNTFHLQANSIPTSLFSPLVL
jgi:hypothetical protein